MRGGICLDCSQARRRPSFQRLSGRAGPFPQWASVVAQGFSPDGHQWVHGPPPPTASVVAQGFSPNGHQWARGPLPRRRQWFLLEDRSVLKEPWQVACPPLVGYLWPLPGQRKGRGGRAESLT